MAGRLYLGSRVQAGDRVELDGDHLTTHAVCLGMTGSGKTGLGIVALEELARQRLPLLVVDLKGDMVNLLLEFPELAPESFAAWLPADLAASGDRAAAGREQAELWRKGLAGAGLGPDDVRAVRDGVRWQLLTPGVAGVAPLDILPALSAPPGWHPDQDPDGASQRVNGLATALLSLIGRGGDPLTDPDTVLLAAIVLEHWRRGDALDLPRLLASIADPPLQSLGALPLESFYPRPERMKLVIGLNTLLASPAFAAWTRGVPLTMEALLGTPAEPRASIVSVAHLEEAQRLFILALIATELVAWMRRQPASAGLRALLYMDEVQGILPPHPLNPPPKAPLLTILKQGRAFGIGAWLATQNPVDLDYKALGNAGIKLIGRLITERDRSRALEGLGLTALPDGREAEAVVTGLGKREFLLVDTRADVQVQTLTTRWAMSYLRGPVTLAEMGPLAAARQGAPVVAPASAAAEPAPSAPVPAVAPTTDGASPTPPVLAAAVPVRFVGAAAGMARPLLRLRSRVILEKSDVGLFRTTDEVWLVPPAVRGLDWESATVGQDLQLVDDPPPGMRFPSAVPATLDRDAEGAATAFVVWRSRRPETVLANRALKLCAAQGESREAFLARCLEAADRADDADQQLVRDRYGRRMEALRRRLEKERGDLEHSETQLGSRKAEETLGVVEGLFSVLLGSRSIRSAASKAVSRTRTVATKHRMRQTAEASVEQSEQDVARVQEELEALSQELQTEVDRIAAASEERARAVEEVVLRPRRSDIAVLEVELAWVV